MLQEVLFMLQVFHSRRMWSRVRDTERAQAVPAIRQAQQQRYGATEQAVAGTCSRASSSRGVWMRTSVQTFGASLTQSFIVVLTKNL